MASSRLQRDAGGEDRRHHRTASSTTGRAPTSSGRRSPTRPGSGSRRRYSYRDLLELRVIKTLLDAGIRLESVREVFDYLRQHVDERHRRGPHRDQRHPGRAVRRRRADRRHAPRPGRAQRARPGRRRRTTIDAQLVPLGGAPSQPGRRDAAGDVTARALAARRRPSRPRRRAWCRSAGGTCRSSTRPGTIAEHLACRSGGGRVRRVPPRDGARRRRRRVRPPAAGAHQRSRARSVRAGRSTPTCSTRPTRRCSTTSSSGGTPSDGGEPVFDVMPNASNTDRVRDAIGGDGDHARPRRARRAGSRRRSTGWPTVFPDAAAVGRFRVGGRPGGRRAARSPAPATRASAASRSPCPPAPPPATVGGDRRRRRSARRPRRARHAAPRGRAAAARQRARTRDHAAAGRPRVGGRVGQGRRSAAARRSAAEREAGRRPPPRRRRHRRPPSAARRLRRARRRRRVGEVTSGNFSPVLDHGIALAFVPPDVEGHGRRRRRPRHPRWPARSCRRRSSVADARRSVTELGVDHAIV